MRSITVLRVLNSLVSPRPLYSVSAVLSTAAAIFGGIWVVLASLRRDDVRWLIAAWLASLGIAWCVRVVAGPLRWHFLYEALRAQLPWFRQHNAQVLVGVGPGGAIIAGMLAKLLGDTDHREPTIIALDRAYEMGEYGEINVSLRKAVTLNTAGIPPGVVVVAPEIHSGSTIKAVAANLNQLGISFRVFAVVWSQKSSRPPQPGDRCLLAVDERAILPWPDAPAKEDHAGTTGVRRAPRSLPAISMVSSPTRCPSRKPPGAKPCAARISMRRMKRR